MKPLRVCHLGKYYHPFRGGIETHVQSLARKQAAAGIDVSIVCINHRDVDGNDVWAKRIATTPTITDWDENVEIIRFGKFATLARFDFCRGIRTFLKTASDRFDLLHLHVPNPMMCVAIAAAAPKLPLVVTYHSDIVKQRYIRKPFRFIERQVLQRAQRIVVATQAYRDSSEVLEPYLTKTVVVPFGIDLDVYEKPTSAAVAFEKQLRDELGDQPLWLCVGRLVYYKGLEHAIRALKHCPGRLMIVGNGDLHEALRNLASELGLNDRILWRERLSDDELLGAYRAATALWFPSILRSEAFGFVQIEAMASGCPVINMDIPGSGVPWVSLDGVSGYTVPLGNSNAFAEAANRLAFSQETREALSIGARVRAHEHFKADLMMRRNHQVYEAILGRPIPLSDPALDSEPSRVDLPSDYAFAIRREG